MPLSHDSYILRQLFDKESFTFSYILGDTHSKTAILIDPVFEKAERDLKLVEELGLKLKYVANTHLHADHVTGTGLIKTVLGKEVKSVISLASGANADLKIKDGDSFKIGKLNLEVRYTPGHTSGCVTLVFHGGRMAFTGDALLIRGCGRTDMQGGCSTTLYNSVHRRIFTLPEDYFVYPAHDYKGRSCSTIGEEKRFNPRLTTPLLEFIGIMKDFGKRIQTPEILSVALAANKACGLYDLPEDMKKKIKSFSKKK